MSNLIVIGAQWGDEGKGKIVDLLSEHADYIVRFNGGANAGHTIKFNDREFVLHLIPSGILKPRSRCFISSGVVIDPDSLIDEIAYLEREGIDLSERRLFVSLRAHLIMPYHKELDSLKEKILSTCKLGTTGRGIGPAYEDKASRIGLRVADLLDMKRFARRLNEVSDLVNRKLVSCGADSIDIDKLILKADLWRSKLVKFFRDVESEIYSANSGSKKMLFEGAQGTMLDLNFGSYPYVTSSNCIAGGVFTSTGLPPNAKVHVLGVCKAYTTRVGEGPFPTELKDEMGEGIRKKGGEFGATTGRIRRCGWLDLVVLRHAVMMNGIQSIALTKMDVLSGMGKIKYCKAYKLGDKVIENLPILSEDMNEALPIYYEIDGFEDDFSKVKSVDDLSIEAKNYVRMIERELKIPVSIISTGKERDRSIVLTEFFTTKKEVL